MRLDQLAELGVAVSALAHDTCGVLAQGAVYQGMNMPLAAHLDMVSSHTSIRRDTPDHRAKVAAFLERRKVM